MAQLQGWHCVQGTKAKPEIGASSNPSPLEPLEPREASELALQDLLELEQCGLRVNLPRAEVLRAEACSEPHSAFASQQAAASTVDSWAEGKPGAPPGSETQSQEVAAALEDLYEMQAAGMQVRLPG